MSIWHIIAAFMSGLTLDVLDTLIFHFTDRNRPFLAAGANTLATACFLYIFIDITKDYTIAVPYLSGIFVGGILGMKLKIKLDSKYKQ